MGEKVTQELLPHGMQNGKKEEFDLGLSGTAKMLLADKQDSIIDKYIRHQPVPKPEETSRDWLNGF